MLLNANSVSAQLLQGIPPSPLETRGGSTDRMPEGVYIMPSFGRYEMVAELVKVLDRDRWSAERSAAGAAEPGGLRSR